MPFDLDKLTKRDERLEEMRLKLLADKCPPRLAEEMVRDARQGLVLNDVMSGFIDSLFASVKKPSPTDPVNYRGDWLIYYDPKPIPTASCDWNFVHDDFDGAPDANDPRCGTGASVEDCKQQIDEYEETERPMRKGEL